MALFTVITADVVESRRQKAEQLSSWLQPRLAELEDPSLLVRFSISQGDEIQGVCRGAIARPQVVRRLRFACRPLDLRIGLGVGDVVDPDSIAARSSSWDMTGPAFFLAREALAAIKNVKAPRTRVRVPDEGLELAINAIYELVDVLAERWTEAQWQAVHAYERAGTYEAAARVLKIAFQNVEKRCRAAKWPVIRNSEAALSTLAGLLEDDHP